MSSQPRLELRRIISNHLKEGGLVTEDRALNVVESLVIKQGRGKLSEDNKALYAELQKAGFISQD